MQEKDNIGKVIATAREKAGYSQRQLAKIAKISNAELSKIESGEREIPNPKTLRKISPFIKINYNDLMYMVGLGLQVSPLNPFLKHHYSELKGEEIDEAWVNTLGSIKNWQLLIDSFKKKVEDKKISETEKEVLLQSIEDTEYQINTAQEIIKLLESAKIKERIKNAKKNGYRSISLTCLDTAYPAHRLYESMGFKKAGSVKYDMRIEAEEEQ